MNAHVVFCSCGHKMDLKSIRGRSGNLVYFTCSYKKCSKVMCKHKKELSPILLTKSYRKIKKDL